MTPRLPTELLAHILALACADEPALARRETRDAFSLVCRDWCESFDRGVEILVNEVDELERVVGWLSLGHARPLGSKEGTRIKAIYVKLTNPKGYGRGINSKQSQWLNKLLRLTDALEWLELELTDGVLSTKQRDEANLDRIAPRTTAHLAKVETLSLIGSGPGAQLHLNSRKLQG